MDFPFQFPAESPFSPDTPGLQFWLYSLLPPEWRSYFCYRGLGLKTLPRSSRRTVWKASGLNGQVFLFFFPHTQPHWIVCISCLVTVIKVTRMKQPKGGPVSSVSQLERMLSIVAETARGWGWIVAGMYGSTVLYQPRNRVQARPGAQPKLISTTHTVLDQPIRVHVQKINPTTFPEGTSI